MNNVTIAKTLQREIKQHLNKCTYISFQGSENPVLLK